MTLREKFHSAAVFCRKAALAAMAVPVALFGYGIVRSALAQYNEHQPHSVDQYVRWGMTDADASIKVADMNKNNAFWEKIGETGDDMADKWVWPAVAAVAAFAAVSGLAAASRPKRARNANLIVRL